MILYFLSANAQDDYYSETECDICMQQKMTTLNFFQHTIFGGKNPNTVLIAQANTTRTDGVVEFGNLFALNSALRVGISPTSRMIGRAKGLQVGASQEYESPTFFVCSDYGFDKGKFNESSFVICSTNSFSEPTRELAVIGGRKKFRMATGFAKIRTAYFSSTQRYAITKHDVTLFHC
ncbi:dirigent protein 4-like [Mercurialis annua]|uniref:dirigent protein 4-like n=1 Tax=Mercurialis annua TaxID=3986 RepID=UPI00215FB664|nr:dirigent protein 4-like [Mercurialis annua]